MSTDKQSLDWYNENSQHYTDHVRNPSDSIYHAYYEKPAMYSLLPDIHNKTVLSLGCGPGEDSNYLKKNCAARSIGIDVSTGLLAHAREAYPECEFSEMNMEHLNFNDSTFEFAYSSLAIHYIEDWSQTFKEVFRVLKPGSYFLFSCNHPTSSAMEITEDEKNNILTLQVKRSNKSTIERTVAITGSYFPRKKLRMLLVKILSTLGISQ